MTDHTQTRTEREERIAREFRRLTLNRTAIERTALSIACLERFYGLHAEAEGLPSDIRRWARQQAERLATE